MASHFARAIRVLGILAMAALVAPDALAQTGAPAAANPSATAWVLTATALVLFMTMPGLAMFYGGLVHARNVLSVLMHCAAVACVVSVLWLAFVYSISFGDGGSVQPWIGGLSGAFLGNVGLDTVKSELPETVFFMFQMTFAIITPALIVGAYVERIKFGAVVLFSALWLIFVYAPICHWVWGDGWLAKMGVRDFAGGLVVHLSAGSSALIAALVIGPRRGFPRETVPPHSPGMTMIGAAMLWVGWYGFNAGSALAANANAGMAMTVTHISAATAALTWTLIEYAKLGRASLIGIVTGLIAGLATITPASGYVGPGGALVIGIAAGAVCYVAVQIIKQTLEIDDSLDVFAVHGVGGALGVLLTAFFSVWLGGLGLPDGQTIGGQFWVQLIGLVATLVWSVVVSFIILKVVQAIVGLRVREEQEYEGLDVSTHGERGYTF
jgi:Amt family ammonium transporter